MASSLFSVQATHWEAIFLIRVERNVAETVGQPGRDIGIGRASRGATLQSVFHGQDQLVDLRRGVAVESISGHALTSVVPRLMPTPRVSSSTLTPQSSSQSPAHCWPVAGAPDYTINARTSAATARDIGRSMDSISFTWEAKWARLPGNAIPPPSHTQFNTQASETPSRSKTLCHPSPGSGRQRPPHRRMEPTSCEIPVYRDEDRRRLPE